MPWKSNDLPPNFTPVTDNDVDLLDEYMALMNFKNQVEQEIIDVMMEEMGLDDEHPNAITHKHNIRHTHQNALMDLQEIICKIENFKF